MDYQPHRHFRPMWDTAEIRNLEAVCHSGNLSLFSGSFTRELEEKFRRLHDASHAVAVNSGTAALHLALASLGITHGDEVIVPSISYVASALAPLYVGALPVFGDIDLQTFNLSVDSCRSLIGPKTRAVIFVHLFGARGGVNEIATLCQEKNLILIEDCAQSCGSVHDGARSGSIGQAACFSFFETKSLSVGEGGILLLRDAECAAKAHALRHHGIEEVSGTRVIRQCGFNYKPSELQSAIALAQLDKIDIILESRMKFGMLVQAAMRRVASVQTVDLEEHVCWDSIAGMFPSQLERDRRMRIRRDGRLKTYWHRPLQDEPVFRGCVADGATPIARTFVKRHAAIKCSPVFDEDDLQNELEEVFG